MEGWEIRRRVARFRGIELEYLGSSRGVGRRQAVHEFAQRDIPFTEDTGRKARTFTVRGATIGADHDLEAERLEAAFEQRGPGELVLPHRAPIMVSVLDATFEEPERETRIQRFSVNFIESGTPTIPTARADTAGIVRGRVATALLALNDRFADVFTISDQTKAAVDRTVEVTDAAVAEVADAFTTLKAGAGVVAELAEFADSIDALATEISGTLVDAAVSAKAFQNSLEKVLALPFKPIDVYRQLADVVAFGATLTDPGTDSVARTSAKRNQDAWVDMVNQSATAVRAEALSRIDFESSTEAAEFRDEIATELAAAIVVASDSFADVAVAALRDLRTSILRDLDARSARLPARVVFVMPATLPALVVAQRLYGDPARDAEIVARNRALIRNPGRIGFGTPLEVLADG